MLASIEWMPEDTRVGLVRVHESGGHGSPWTFGCVLRDQGNGAPSLVLATRCPTMNEARAIRKALWVAGYQAVEWERRNVRRAHTAVVKRGARPASGVNVEKEIAMAQAQAPATTERISVIHIIIAHGDQGFNDEVVKRNTVSREKYEEFQRAMASGLLGMQKTAEAE